jgi:hypothetical protein
MSKYKVTLTRNGLSSPETVMIEADGFDVEISGLVTLIRGNDTVGAFAAGCWACIERIEPDKYAEATAAVS